ncbi:hypothetical protein [Noviherbaspirillum sp. Root189]|uniref:hypothetical protein n=1 Tax=Noviherbaspirillum sp. Root189 TaxID=1736487 RepID=UPI000709482F|nr:hypothetical protein [Noviherbaspirillum sp. Root189]KRB94135.1 hypothetical protein ASE07_00960 [Noviherbaspirillum sp. Root189]
MTIIIAGRFQEQAEADDTIAELLRAGFPRDRVSTFYCNPAGQHATYPIGGDSDKSPGAKSSDKSAAAGAAAGAVIGVAATPILGPVGTVTGGLVGAHLGGLVGGLSGMKEKGDVGDHAEDVENAVPMRRSGMMVAVAVPDQEYEDRALQVLRTLGAVDIERAEGTIENGDWSDFDPMAPMNLVQYAPEHSRPSGPNQRA